MAQSLLSNPIAMALVSRRWYRTSHGATWRILFATVVWRSTRVWRQRGETRLPSPYFFKVVNGNDEKHRRGAFNPQHLGPQLDRQLEARSPRNFIGYLATLMFLSI